MKKIMIMIILLMLIFTGCGFNMSSKIEVDKESVDSGEESLVSNSADIQSDKEIIKDLKVIGEKIVNVNDHTIVKDLLKKHKNSLSVDVNYIYYSSVDGSFIIYPEVDMPEDYDFHERPPYIKAIEDGIYSPEPYEDAVSKKMIKTIAIKVEKNSETRGVLAIDYILNEK